MYVLHLSCSLDKRKEIGYLAGIVIFVILAYRPITFLQHTLIWDMRDQSLPWRYFIGTCASRGIFPLWNPYLQGGYPFFANPQSGAFYPIALLLGMVSGYPLQVLNLEFLLTVVVGSVGMYQLVRSFSCHRGASSIGAVCFATCGLFVGNAEHLSWIVSVAWLTWFAWSYRMMVSQLKYGYGILCAIFLFLVLTGGYPAFLFISGYIVAVAFVVLLAIRDRQTIIRLVALHVAIVAVFAILSGVVVVGFAEAMQYINRGAGVTLEKANMGAFTPQAMLSLLAPFLTVGDFALWKTDISLSNGYFGIVALVLLACAIPMERKYWGVWAISVLCLLISFGPYLPLRGWMYRFMPLMNLFRFPSIFRAFFLMGVVLLASVAANRILEDPNRYRKRLAVFSAILVFGFSGILVFEFARHGFRGNYVLFFREPGKYIGKLTFHERVIMQSAIQMVLLALLGFVAHYRQSKFLKAPVLFFLCAADMWMATQLNLFATVVNDDKLEELAEGIRKQPRDFPLPALTQPVWQNRDGIQDGLEPLWANLGVFKQRVSPDGYDPFTLKSYDSLEVFCGRDSVWGNPVAYLCHDVAELNALQPLPGKNVAAVDRVLYGQIRGKLSEQAKGDTIWIEKFEPGDVQLTTRTKGRVLVVLQQADYPGWNVCVDGEKTEHFRTAYTNVTVMVPGGSHRITYKFMPRYFKGLAAISFSALLLLPVVLALYRKRLF